MVWLIVRPEIASDLCLPVTPIPEFSTNSFCKGAQELTMIARTLWSSWSMRAGILCLAALTNPANAAQINIPCPSNCVAFGTTVAVLPNGNIVVVDPWASTSGHSTNVGAVYLYSPAGMLISSLTGSNTNDHIGNGGVVVLTSGNFVVVSNDWNGNSGAVTWVNGTSGLSGVVTANNSLVGAASNNGVGFSGVTALSNGNYVVASPNWNNGAATQAGAVTWGNGTIGTTGSVSASNSLVGTTTNDAVGSRVFALSNGNYVVASHFWNNGTAAKAGAVTWGNGTAGITGEVSESNSLVGTTTDDQVGGGAVDWGITVLSNGNYVVTSPSWNNGAATTAGAATWGDGTVGITGAVSASNSLVGTTTGDLVSYYGVTALSNGNYVVTSPYWTNAAVASVGAATWANGTTGLTGAISANNSLVGTISNDSVGYGGATALSNGNYVIASFLWDGGKGAATWGDGSTGITGTVSASNSLIGTTPHDQVGSRSITALSNGNYVVASPNWNGAATQAGAVTWGQGTTGVTGEISAINSLVGTTTGDEIGEDGVTALSNGNYVVASPSWSSGAGTQVGAATWGDGATGITGTVSTNNSLIGKTTNYAVGLPITALSNGNYVVASPSWSNALSDVGAATWGNGTTGFAGIVSANNSLIGTSTNDAVGQLVAPQIDGNFVISSPSWNGGVGAITLASGQFRLVGTIQGWNSVVGSAANNGFSLVFAYDPIRRQLVVGRPADNIVSLMTMDQLFSDGFEP